MKAVNRKLIIGLLILAFLTPLGVILPDLFRSGNPFGESPSDSLKKELGYVPKGMAKEEKTWEAPAKNYSLGKNERPLWQRSLLYAGSGLFAAGIIALGSLWLQKIYKKNE
jgi:cobalt/nickel transport protein